MLVALVLVVLMAEARTLPVRLEITETEVRARQGRWRGQPDKQAPRSEIRAIHYYPAKISFRGAGDQPVMEPEPHWTVRQMLKVAQELGVPLYDHRGVLGVEELSVGRVAYDPCPETGRQGNGHLPPPGALFSMTSTGRLLVASRIERSRVG